MTAELLAFQQQNIRGTHCNIGELPRRELVQQVMVLDVNRAVYSNADPVTTPLACCGACDALRQADPPLLLNRSSRLLPAISARTKAYVHKASSIFAIVRL